MNFSVTGKEWHLVDVDERQAMSLANQLAVPEVIARILTMRGITELDDALPFLTPRLKDLPDPSHLLDMDIAVERIISAVQKNEKIVVFGDYDVDGNCASAILIRFFRSIGHDVLLYIPDRMTEGYGPNVEAMDKLKEMGAQLVITVDCGSVAFEPMAHAKDIGLDVIITDHHQTLPERPACVAMINPNRVDETSPCTMLSGAGIAFYVVLATTRKLREMNFFTADLKEPDNRLLLDLVAVSTVCDMVPLTGPNRILVGQGLKAMSMGRNIGLNALAQVAGVDEAMGTYHVGFVIGPRINAGGRIAECDLGAKLLSTENNSEAIKLSEKLNYLNEERKELEKAVLEEALAQAEKVFQDDTKALVLAGEGWHEGVIGIVASRVKEKYHRPTIIISVDGETGKGSGRSISGVDLGRIIIESNDLLLKGGGHKMAAGLSIETKNIEAFMQKVNQLVAEQAEQSGRDIFTPSIKIDGSLGVGAVNKSFMDKLDCLSPYGTGHAEPRFAFNGVKIGYAKAVGADGAHVQVSIHNPGGEPLKGIAFKAMDNDLGHYILHAQKTGQPVSLCGTIRRNVWNGKETYQLQISDAWDGTWLG